MAFEIICLVEISFQLFGDNKPYPTQIVRTKLQSRILTSFMNGLTDKQNSEAELFLHELMTQGSPYPREDITFLKAMRLLIAMSKRRHGKVNLTYVIHPKQFRHAEFSHYCNANFDPSFNLSLIIRTSMILYFTLKIILTLKKCSKKVISKF